MDVDRTVAALCVHAKTVYRSIAGVEVYDKRRDLRTFAGDMPVVCHPPCRAWSAFCRHQAKPEQGEAELGLICADWLRQCGGVLEHPAHSRLFDAAKLPQPGERRERLMTIAVWQAWWGYGIKKATWLCLSGVDADDVHLPFQLHEPRGDRRRFAVLSKQQRSRTCEPFGRWLVDVARRSRVVEERGIVQPISGV